MGEIELSERKKIILKAIVDAHIHNGEPVGSKYLAEMTGLPCSTATIRNEMAELEEMGYLEQPHTSAGRIPSDSGYRFYVDSLLQGYHMTAQELDKINLLLRAKLSELDKILDHASKLASALTNYTGLAVKPKVSIQISRFEVLYLNSRNLILVMLTTVGIARTKNFRLGFDISPEDAAQLATVLNDCAANRSPEQITLPLIIEMEHRMGPNRRLVDPMIKCVYETLSDLDEGKLRIEGFNRLLQYPEYADINRLRALLDFLEQKEDILNIITSAKRDHVNVCIGSESAVDIMSNSTLVFKMIKNRERVVGAIGILGPSRMDYSRVIAMIDRLATGICEMLSGEDILLSGQ